ncbi:MAG: hypothetical protein HRT99_00905 [Mycoplasmatales bacterium]|nr:hypothetical protein [Mycoplasmatales bacterium]
MIDKWIALNMVGTIPAVVSIPQTNESIIVKTNQNFNNQKNIIQDVSKIVEKPRKKMIDFWNKELLGGNNVTLKYLNVDENKIRITKAVIGNKDLDINDNGRIISGFFSEQTSKGYVDTVKITFKSINNYVFKGNLKTLTIDYNFKGITPSKIWITDDITKMYNLSGYDGHGVIDIYDLDRYLNNHFINYYQFSINGDIHTTSGQGPNVVFSREKYKFGGNISNGDFFILKINASWSGKNSLKATKLIIPDGKFNSVKRSGDDGKYYYEFKWEIKGLSGRRIVVEDPTDFIDNHFSGGLNGGGIIKIPPPEKEISVKAFTTDSNNVRRQLRIRNDYSIHNLYENQKIEFIYKANSPFEIANPNSGSDSKFTYTVKKLDGSIKTKNPLDDLILSGSNNHGSISIPPKNWVPHLILNTTFKDKNGNKIENGNLSNGDIIDFNYVVENNKYRIKNKSHFTYVVNGLTGIVIDDPTVRIRRDFRGGGNGATDILIPSVPDHIKLVLEISNINNKYRKINVPNGDDYYLENLWNNDNIKFTYTPEPGYKIENPNSGKQSKFNYIVKGLNSRIIPKDPRGKIRHSNYNIPGSKQRFINVFGLNRGNLPKNFTKHLNLTWSFADVDKKPKGWTSLMKYGEYVIFHYTPDAGYSINPGNLKNAKMSGRTLDLWIRFKDPLKIHIDKPDMTPTGINGKGIIQIPKPPKNVKWIAKIYKNFKLVRIANEHGGDNKIRNLRNGEEVHLIYSPLNGFELDSPNDGENLKFETKIKYLPGSPTEINVIDPRDKFNFTGTNHHGTFNFIDPNGNNKNLDMDISYKNSNGDSISNGNLSNNDFVEVKYTAKNNFEIMDRDYENVVKNENSITFKYKINSLKGIIVNDPTAEILNKEENQLGKNNLWLPKPPKHTSLHVQIKNADGTKNVLIQNDRIQDIKNNDEIILTYIPDATYSIEKPNNGENMQFSFIAKVSKKIIVVDPFKSIEIQGSINHGEYINPKVNLNPNLIEKLIFTDSKGNIKENGKLSNGDIIKYEYSTKSSLYSIDENHYPKNSVFRNNKLIITHVINDLRGIIINDPTPDIEKKLTTNSFKIPISPKNVKLNILVNNKSAEIKNGNVINIGNGDEITFLYVPNPTYLIEKPNDGKNMRFSFEASFQNEVLLFPNVELKINDNNIWGLNSSKNKIAYSPNQIIDGSAFLKNLSVIVHGENGNNKVYNNINALENIKLDLHNKKTGEIIKNVVFEIEYTINGIRPQNKMPSGLSNGEYIEAYITISKKTDINTLKRNGIDKFSGPLIGQKIGKYFIGGLNNDIPNNISWDATIPKNLSGKGTILINTNVQLPTNLNWKYQVTRTNGTKTDWTTDTPKNLKNGEIVDFKLTLLNGKNLPNPIFGSKEVKGLTNIITIDSNIESMISNILYKNMEFTGDNNTGKFTDKTKEIIDQINKKIRDLYPDNDINLEFVVTNKTKEEIGDKNIHKLSNNDMISIKIHGDSYRLSNNYFKKVKNLRNSDKSVDKTLIWSISFGVIGALTLGLVFMIFWLLKRKKIR